MITLKKYLNLKNVFYSIVLLLPLNLGKHFIIKDSYLNGVLFDYLIPTLYLQDILVLIFVIGSFIKTKRNVLLKTFEKKEFILFLLLLLSVLVSVIFAEVKIPAIEGFLRLSIYFLFLIGAVSNFHFKDIFPVCVKLFGYSVSFLAVLALLQFSSQKSIFNNYLFFGEQPYSYSTPGVVRESLFGLTKIPSYGTFRHPNIFGGFLSIVLIWLFAAGYYFAFILGALALMVTFSFTSFASLVLGLTLYVLRRNRLVLFISVLLIFLLLFGSILLPFYYEMLPDSLSLVRRARLTHSAYTSLGDLKFIYGVGVANGVVHIERVLPYFKETHFIQPVHNIFVNLLLEGGILAILSFAGIIISSLKRSINNRVILFISILQIILLGSFDHYFLDIHQTLLLLFVVFVFVWTI